MSLTWLHTWEAPDKVVLLWATNNQSLEEQCTCLAQKVLGFGLGELGYTFLWEVKENSRFFFRDNCFFFRKAQQIFWRATDASIVENSPDKPLCWPEMTRQVSVFRIYRIVIKSAHRGRHKKFRNCIFSPKSTSIWHLVGNPLPFYYTLKLLNFNFVIYFFFTRKSLQWTSTSSKFILHLW